MGSRRPAAEAERRGELVEEGPRLDAVLEGARVAVGGEELVGRDDFEERRAESLQVDQRDAESLRRATERDGGGSGEARVSRYPTNTRGTPRGASPRRADANDP